MTKHEAPLNPAALPEEVRQKIAFYSGNIRKAIEDNLPVEPKKGGKSVPFVLNTAQLKLHLLWEKIRLHNLEHTTRANKADPSVAISDGPVRIICLKARQVGVSTYCQARFFIHACWTPNLSINVTAHQEKPAQNIMRKARNFYKGWRGDSRLRTRTDTASEDEIAWGHNSRIVVNTAGSKSAARGYTYAEVHISESAHIEDYSGISALLDAVPSDGVIIDESTANGDAGPFKEKWDGAMWFEDVVKAFAENDFAALERWNGYFRYFFAWWEEPTYRVYLSPEHKAFVEKSLDQTERDLMNDYPITLEQIEWRRRKIKDKKFAPAQGISKEQHFQQEYPACPEEAFVGRGARIFDQRALKELEEMARHRMPLARFMLTDNFVVRNESGNANLVVFDPPRPGHLYVGGSDVAQGEVEDGDYHVTSIWDRTFPDHLVEVARFRDRALETRAYADVITILCEWYNNAWLCHESNNHGIVVSYRLIENRYVFVYRRRALDQLRPDELDSRAIGYNTNSSSRSAIYGASQVMIRDGIMEIRSPQSIKEHKEFQMNPEKKKAMAPVGGNDDCVIADGLAMFMHGELPEVDRRVIRESLPEMAAAVQGEAWAAIRAKVTRDEKRNKKALGRNWKPRAPIPV